MPQLSVPSNYQFVQALKRRGLVPQDTVNAWLEMGRPDEPLRLRYEILVSEDTAAAIGEALLEAAGRLPYALQPSAAPVADERSPAATFVPGEDGLSTHACRKCEARPCDCGYVMLENCDTCKNCRRGAAAVREAEGPPPRSVRLEPLEPQASERLSDDDIPF
jgi:hypothetical protein